uniref:HTH OST-type domain-containing protein n=1 Tax=Glossina austeni TaxID=7395 RepID=A0A1A9UWI3_GLOAU
MYNEDLNVVKTTLKSLIISYPYKTTIKRLNNRYRDVEGDDIPFHNFGYSDLEAFLRSMPDTFTLFDDGHTFLVRVVTGAMSPNNTNETIEKEESKENSSSHTSNILNSQADKEIERNVLSNGLNNLKIEKEEAQPMHRQDKDDSKQSSRTRSERRRKANNNNQLDSVRTTLRSLRLRNWDEQNASLTYEEKLGLIHKILRQRRQNRRNALCIEKKEEEKLIRNVRSNDLNKCEHKGQQKPKQPLENRWVTAYNNRTQSKNPFEKININDQPNDFEKRFVSLASFVISSDKRSIINQNSLGERKRNRTHNCVRNSAYFAIQEGTQMAKESNKGQQEVAYFLLCHRVSESPFNTNQGTVYNHKNKPNSGLENDDIRNQTTKSNKTLLDGITFWRSETKSELSKTVAKFAPRPKKISPSIPASAMYCGFTFSNSYKPSRTIRDARLKIVINEIHSPYKFWFHFCPTNPYLDMLTKMSTWYRDYKENEWQIPLNLLAPRRVCVAFHEDNWYRGRIVSWPTNHNKVKVFCVDYGNVHEIDVNRIKFLHQRFANIPTLAMRGSLTCVRPLQIHWSHSATKRFRDMTLALIVEAEVVDIDYAQSIYYLRINNKIVNISSYLVEQNLARYNRSCDLRRAYQKFPTFSMLESGEYPSFTELTHLLDKGFDYETIYDPLVQRLTTVSQDAKIRSAVLYNFPFNLIITNPFYADIIKQLQSRTASQRKFSR